MYAGLIVAAAVVSIGMVGISESFAHMTTYDGDIKIVIGHSNEPSFGHEEGVWLGMHNVNAILSQDDIPIGDATLQVDKYYFEDAKQYNKADSLDDAEQESLANELSKQYGTDNRYESRQIVTDGIYVYRVYGEANSQDVDVTVACFDEDMDDPYKFNNYDSSTKKFGCPENIEDLKFPGEHKKGHHDKDDD